MKPSRLQRLSFIALCLAASLPALQAEVRTLTDRQGRSIKADVIEVENGAVKIRREDGQTFTLPLANLSDADQKELKAWAAANPPRLKPEELPLQFSRGKFSTEKELLSEGAVTAYKEQWGYSLTLSNKSKRALTDLRADYVLFVKEDQGPGNKDAGKFRRMKKSSPIDTIPLHGSLTFRTDTVASYRYVLQPGFVWAGGGGSSKPIKDTLHGMWLRIYSGDQLVIEKVVPEDLIKTEKW
jgi:hypothetical protein